MLDINVINICLSPAAALPQLLPGRGCGSESDSANESLNELPAAQSRAPTGALKAYPVVLKTQMVCGSLVYLFIFLF